MVAEVVEAQTGRTRSKMNGEECDSKPDDDRIRMMPSSRQKHPVSAMMSMYVFKYVMNCFWYAHNVHFTY